MIEKHELLDDCYRRITLVQTTIEVDLCEDTKLAMFDYLEEIKKLLISIK
jgi:hypothetical protein